MSKPFYYRLIPEDDMDLGVLGDAHCVLNYCVRVLGLGGVKIQWVQPISVVDRDIEDSLFEMQKICTQLGSGKWPSLGYNAMKQGEFYGAFFPLKAEKTIYIRADLGLRRICGAIAHECKHVADFGPRAPGCAPIDPKDNTASEARAERFAGEVLQALLARD